LFEIGQPGDAGPLGRPGEPGPSGKPVSPKYYTWSKRGFHYYLSNSRDRKDLLAFKATQDYPVTKVIVEIMDRSDHMVCPVHKVYLALKVHKA
jgi:hypothetical protein